MANFITILIAFALILFGGWLWEVIPKKVDEFTTKNEKRSLLNTIISIMATIIMFSYIFFATYCVYDTNSKLSKISVKGIFLKQKCILTKKCEYKKFGKQRFIFKNAASEDILYEIFNNPVVLNINSGIIHYPCCPSARTCTKNCVYLEEEQAFKLIDQNPLVRWCNVENNIIDKSNLDEFAEQCIMCYDCEPDERCMCREAVCSFFEENSVIDVYRDSDDNADEYDDEHEYDDNYDWDDGIEDELDY